MPRHPSLLAALFVLGATTPALAAPAPSASTPSLLTKVKSRVTEVTLYRGQALVTRTVTLPAKTGELQLLVEDLPNRIDGSSLSATSRSVAVRSVRYRTQATRGATNPEVAKLDKRRRALDIRLGELRQRIRLVDEKLGVYRGQMGFVAPTAKVEMKKGVLDPKKLKVITDHNLASRDALFEAKLKLRQDERDTREERNLLNRKRRELTRGRHSYSRQAVLFVDKRRSGRAELRLSYLVRSASWSPTYNVRASRDGRSVKVEYLADVRQMSGETWPRAEITLSTATPRMSAESPILGPLWVGLGGQKGGGKRRSKRMSFKSYAQSQRRIRAQQQRLAGRPGRPQAGWMMNKLAADGQRLELNTSSDVVRAGRRAVRAAEEALAVSYRIPGRMSLESRSDRQMIKIATLNLDATVFYEAVPLFSSYVTRYARAVNTSDLPLLAGAYRAYSDGEFVGRGRIGVIARGQDFTIGLGADTQLRCYRELIDKKSDTSWGDRVQTFDYRLRIESYKKRTVDVRLYDRIPASKTEHLKIKLTKNSAGLSKEPVYRRDDRPKGILRWDLKVAAGTRGAKARDVRYSFEMKYAKDQHVGREARGLEREMQKDFRAMAR